MPTFLIDSNALIWVNVLKSLCEAKNIEPWPHYQTKSPIIFGIFIILLGFKLDISIIKSYKIRESFNISTGIAF